MASPVTLLETSTARMKPTSEGGFAPSHTVSPVGNTAVAKLRTSVCWSLIIAAGAHAPLVKAHPTHPLTASGAPVACM